MFTIVKGLIKDVSGDTAIEYDLIAALLPVAGVVALTNVGTSLQNMFTSVSTTLNNAVVPPARQPRLKACHRSGERQAWWAWGDGYPSPSDPLLRSTPEVYHLGSKPTWKRSYGNYQPTSSSNLYRVIRFPPAAGWMDRSQDLHHSQSRSCHAVRAGNPVRDDLTGWLLQ
jgi:pilus assembly protein Flp/PilA